MARPRPSRVDRQEAPRRHELLTEPLATRAAWGVIAALAVALLAIALGPHRIGAFDVETDFYGGYAPAALQIQHGGYVAADGRLPDVFGFVGPLYPLLLAGAGAMLHDLFGAAELLSVAACVATLALWFLLLRRRAGARLALVVVLLLATNPVLARYGYSVTTDATALALQSAALFLLLGCAGGAAALGAGLCVGLAALTRYTGAYLVPAGLIAIAAGMTLHPRRRRAALLFVAGFLALTLPWQLYAARHGAEVQFHQLFAFDVYGNARGIEWDDFLATLWPRFRHAPLAVLTADPGAVVARLGFNLGDHLRRDAALLLRWPVAALAACGLLVVVVARRDRALPRVAPLVLPDVWAYLALVPAPSSERYSLAVLPFYLVLAAAACIWAMERAASLRGRQASLAVLGATGVVVAVSLAATIRTQAHVLAQQPLEILACADRLRSLAAPGDRVLARKPNLAFHAGLATEYFPASESLAVLARVARDAKVRWLFVSPAEVMLRPATAYLLDTTAAVPGLARREFVSIPITIGRVRWRRVAALYEIGPAFGEPPAWFGSDTLRALHTLRGETLAIPDPRPMMSLARLELAIGNRAGVRAAWREASGLDPAGVARLLARHGGDTLDAVAHVGAVLK